MRRYLVVANQTLLGERLLAEIRRRVAAGPCQFHVVVPATHALERFRAEGAVVDGEVGDASPLEAIRDVLRREPPFDEVILSTLPPGLSRWIGQDLPHRIGRAFDLPIALVVAEPAVV